MKKLIIFLLATLCSTSILAQNQFEGKDTIRVNGTTYKLKWDFPPGRIFELDNVNNLLITDYLITKRGDTISSPVKKVKLAKEGADADVIRKVFSKREIELFKKSYPDSLNPESYTVYKPFILYAVALDDNGNILNIRFRISRYPGILNNLKPEKIYQLERKFKEEVKFTIPPEYKNKYQYIHSWFYRVNFDSL